MLNSDLCILNKLDKNVKFNMGECKNDKGGYFIIDGKEKFLFVKKNLLIICSILEKIIMKYIHIQLK